MSDEAVFSPPSPTLVNFQTQMNTTSSKVMKAETQLNLLELILLTLCLAGVQFTCTRIYGKKHSLILYSCFYL
jgi:hypothetical protein